jgi:hypothetical protein
LPGRCLNSKKNKFHSQTSAVALDSFAFRANHLSLSLVSALVTVCAAVSTGNIMDTGYILLACGLVGLAIAYNLWGPRRTKAQRLRLSWSGRAWLTRELSRGDLHALADLARGRYGNIDMGQIAGSSAASA